MICDKSSQHGALKETALSNSVLFMCCEAGHHLMEPSMVECPLPRLRAAWSQPPGTAPRFCLGHAAWLQDARVWGPYLQLFDPPVFRQLQPPPWHF